MAKGISVFLGMDYSLEDNLSYIQAAHAAGFTKVFTSLHIPEADYQQIAIEFTQRFILILVILQFQYLNIKQDNLLAFNQLGINTLRLDYGFKPQLIADYSNNELGLKVEFNASTMTNEFMTEIMECGANPQNLSGCHNYYPRQNTGISIQSLLYKNQIFHGYGIEVSAFAALLDNQRGPLYEGLPTLECTRRISPYIALQLLFLLGCDNVILGDSQADIGLLQRLGCGDSKVIELEVIHSLDNQVYADLFNQIHTNRPDSAEDVIRSQESRLVLLENEYKNIVVSPENCQYRPRGAITIDNSKYLRYSGELQICKRELAADERVNVIGKITPESLILLDYIGDNQRFKLLKQC